MKKKKDKPVTDVVPVEEGSNQLSREDSRKSIEMQVRKELGKGKNDYEIMQKLGLTPAALAKYKTRIWDIDREQFESYDNVKVYSQLKLMAEQNIKDLDDVKTKFRNRGQWTALVAAIKQKHEICKDMFKMGQELGYIDKRVTEMKVENEFTFSTMTKEDVMKEVEKERAKLNQMAGMNVIEMRPELMEMLDDDTERIKKFVPSNVKMDAYEAESIPVSKSSKTKIKVKQKLKLKK